MSIDDLQYAKEWSVAFLELAAIWLLPALGVAVIAFLVYAIWKLRP